MRDFYNTYNFKKRITTFLLLPAVIFSGAGIAFCDDSCFTEESIRKLMLKVNAYTRDNPYMETDRNWIRGTYYTGVMGAYKTTGNDLYLEQAMAWANKHNWQPGTNERPGGNILTSAQTYLELFFIKNDRIMIQPTIDWLETPRPNTPAGSKTWYLEGLTVRRYSDSLYVGPPALAMLAKATGDYKYIDWMNSFYDDVCEELYDKEDDLFFRDKRFIYKKSPGEKKIFWSRGNGWVLAGLPRIMEYLPADDLSYEKYKKLFLTMSESVLKRQHYDGLWRANLGDPDHYTMPETSGTAFFTYALAWGINQGLLERDVYLPAVIKGWYGLVKSVYPDGKLAWVQPVDSQPRPSRPMITHEYAAGLFLLAGGEVLKSVNSGAIQSEDIARHLPDYNMMLPPQIIALKNLDKSTHPLAEKINIFMERQSKVSNFNSTGLARNDYLEVIAGQVKVIQGYQDDKGRIIDPVFKKEMYYSTPCYAHSVAALAAGKYPVSRELIESGMKALDSSLYDVVNNRSAQGHADFFTLPILYAYELFASVVSDQRRAKWSQLIARIDPAKAYRHYRKPFTDQEHWPFYNNFNKNYANNWNIVHTAGEYLRHLHGHTNMDYVDYCMTMQLPHFNTLGMYDEEGSPLSYDLFSRHYLTGMLQRGYRSFVFTTYRDLLWKGAWTSLFIQSPTGELPTGWRSSQHIWNEAQEAMVFEIYAAQYAKAGRFNEAGAFKRAAHLALSSVMDWIRPDGTGYIVKNRYPIENRHGHEAYSVHTCYNMLACSILAQAWQFADDSIQEKPCPADLGGFVVNVPDFHKIFANADGTYIEYDTTGDYLYNHHEYNPAGLIRIHLKDGHPQLGPSDGCAVGGVYYKQGSGVNYAVGPAWKDAEGNWTKLADIRNIRPELEVLEEEINLVKLRITYKIKSGSKADVTLTETIAVKPNEVLVTDMVQGEGVSQLRIYYPMLVFDGNAETDVQMDRRSLRMQLDGRSVSFEIMNSLEATLVRTNQKLKHRNGLMEPVYFDINGMSARYRISTGIK